MRKILKSVFHLLPVHLQINIREKILNPAKSIFKRRYTTSYSQCGEDIIAQLYLPEKKGIYVDVGAYHPVEISNTYLFYKKGWNGINIDATQSVIKSFNKYRPKDINVHCCVGSPDGKEVVFYKFKSGALNTFNKDELGGIKLYHNEVPVSEEKLTVRSLASILDEHLKEGQQIDLLSIDAEGTDEEVLRSNNWIKYQPSVIIIENHSSITNFLTSDIYNFLAGYKYLCGGFSRHSFIFYKAPQA